MPKDNDRGFRRWKDFALRMVRTCYGKSRRPTSRWIAMVVEGFFDCFDEAAIPCIVDWDNSTEYPRGNPHRQRECLATYCGCNGHRRKHDNRPNPTCPECRGSGTHHAWERPYPVCDVVAEHLDDYRGCAPRCHTCEKCEWEKQCRCDEINKLHYEQWNTQWGDPVECCLRAGLDVAFSPSAGVLGFTAGDIRRMYPEGVPGWVTGDGPWVAVPVAGVVPGVGFVLGEPASNGTFDELPDNAEIWV